MSENEKKERETYYNSKPRLGGNGPSKIRQQFNRGMTYFLVIAASLAFYFALLRFRHIFNVLWKVYDVLKPIIYGAVIAYLLNPIVKRVDKRLIPVLEKKVTKPGRAQNISRSVGVFTSLIVLLALISALCNLLIPELYVSIRDMIYTLPEQLNHMVSSLNDIKLEDSTTGSIVNELMSNLTVGVLNFLGEVVNFLIGVIVSIYILFSKELFAKQCKKIVYAVLPIRHANLLLHLTTKSNEIFGGFIIGKIIDSAIIGVLCFFGLSILNMPYTLLVSVIVGVTNVIPFFGPYIGAVPSAILIMLDSPIKGLYFLIFILVLQQFDGNILGPKILGNSTGLSAFWVIVAILLGGGLFGFPGMLMGVPTFAVIYYIVQMLVSSKLEQKMLPKNTEAYDQYSYVDNAGQYVHSSQEHVHATQEYKYPEHSAVHMEHFGHMETFDAKIRPKKKDDQEENHKKDNK